MKLGRYYKPGDTIPCGTTFIEFKSDVPERAVIAKTECDSTVLEHYNGAMYEVLDFEWPTQPPQPEIGEVWEVEDRQSRKRHFARYQGEKNKMQYVFELRWFSFFPCEVRFVRRWTPDGV